jgi:hypothetical protein
MVMLGRIRKGASRLGCLIQIAIVAAIFYVASVAGHDALMYYRFKDAMRNETMFAASRGDSGIKARLQAFTDSVDLPASARNINIVREENRIRIWSQYDKVYKLPLNHTKVIHLRPSAEASF